MLTQRLTTVVDAGVMTEQPYREPGSLARTGHHLTPAGAELRIVLGSLQQWGDAHVPYEAGPTVVRRTADPDASEHPVHVAFVDDTGTAVPAEQVAFDRTAAYPT